MTTETARPSKAKPIIRTLLAAFMIAAGVLHFVSPAGFVRIVPRYLPAHLLLVYVSGFFEVLFGAGLLVPQTRRLSGWGLIALYLAVFPANLNMALNRMGFGDETGPLWILWARLPLQLVLIALAYWFTKDPRSTGPQARREPL